MRLIYVIIFLLWSNTIYSQDTFKVYDWEDVKTASPDSVFGISFKRMKLDSLPAELKVFNRLKYLDISKNHLAELPTFIAEFKFLEELNAGKNKMIYFPIQVCKLKKLNRLILNRNLFEIIPSCIGNLSELEYLDVYDTPVGSLPESLVDLKNLKEIDFSGIRYNKEFQEKWRSSLPNVKLVFDAPCNCM